MRSAIDAANLRLPLFGGRERRDDCGDDDDRFGDDDDRAGLEIGLGYEDDSELGL